MAESIQIASKWLKDVNDVNFFPVTHINAVRDENNDPLSTLLDRKQDTITTDNKLSWDLVNHPTIPTVNNATLTIQRNGVLQGTFTANASSNKTINIPVPTSAADVSALPSSTKYGASLNMSLDSSTYVLTIQLKDQDGNNLGDAKTVDLPLESMVTGGSYSNTTKKITLTQQGGGSVEISIGDIISGLQPAINASNKLSADYISDGTTNKAYTATEKTKLNGIQTGAEVNVQSDWNVVDNSLDSFIKNKPTIGNGTLTIWQNQTSKGTFTANQNSASDITITVPTKTSDLTNDSGFLNGNSKLNALQDVSITSATNNQSLVYENGMWVNKMVQSIPTPITYSELVTLRNNSNLVPNTTYRITDYVTEINPYMTNLLYYWGANSEIYDMEIARVSPNYIQYDILVTAIDDSHLSEDCRMVPHSGVTFFDNYDITSWKIKYTIDNDVERFAWAKNYYDVTIALDGDTINGVMIKTRLKSKVNNVDGYDMYLFTTKVDGQCANYMFGIANGHTPAASETVYEVMQGVTLTINSATQVLGKGVVYSMEDCFSNKLCYDYLNIQYKLFAITDVTTSNSNLSDHITDIKTSLVYNANGTKARFSSVVSTVAISERGITPTTDFNNFDWYYTFDLYDETNDTHTNVFYLCDNVTLEKSLSSCWIMYGMGGETWNLPYNVFQYNKSYVDTPPLSESESSGLRFPKPVLLHSLNLSEYVYGNVWYYDGDAYTINGNDLINYFVTNDVETPKHVYGTIFVNSLKIKTCGCLYGTIINSSNVNIEGTQNLFSYKLFDSTIDSSGISSDFIFINDKRLSIGTDFSGYICNCSKVSVGNRCIVNLIGNLSNNMEYISIGNNSSLEIITDTNASSTSIRYLVTGNNSYVYTNNNVKFTGAINKLTIGDNCNSISLKNNLYCNYVVVEPGTSDVLLTSESLPSDNYLSNIIVRNTPNIAGTYGDLSTDFITESFRTVHRVGRNSSGVAVCYVEEDLVAPAAYAPNGVTYTVSGNNITFTIPSGYNMYWTLDGRNPSKLVCAGSASTSTTVTLTDGQTIKYISYNSSLPKDRWATQIYFYTHHVN